MAMIRRVSAIAVTLVIILIAQDCDAFYDESPECDHCRTLVEGFHEGWEKVVTRQAAEGQADNKKSDAPPTITYNQDIEDYLQGFCKSERITKYASKVATDCNKVMDVHKREIVGKFLSVSEVVGGSMKATNVPKRAREVCGTMAGVCKKTPPAHTKGVKVSKCTSCQRVIKDAQYVLRRSKKCDSKLSSLDVFEHLETLCADVYKRYDDDPTATFKICEELWEEHEDTLTHILSKKSKDAVSKICVDATDMCDESEIESSS